MTTATIHAKTFATRFVWAFVDAWVLAKRHLIQIPHIPDKMIFATIQPIMFVLLFRFVFEVRSNSRCRLRRLFDAWYLLQTVIFGATTTGIGLAQDLEKGLIDRFRSLPMAKSAVLTGRTIADLVRNVFVVIVMFAVGLLVGFRPSSSPLNLFAAIALMLLVSLRILVDFSHHRPGGS